MNYVADKAKVDSRVVYLCLPRVQDGFEFFLEVIWSRFTFKSSELTTAKNTKLGRSNRLRNDENKRIDSKPKKVNLIKVLCVLWCLPSSLKNRHIKNF
jgi:hypothetical protein